MTGYAPPAMAKTYDLIVIGGGISGLSLAAFAARKGVSTLVLEKESRLGGALRTVRRGDGFWFELGAHTLYNSYGALIEALEASGPLVPLRRKKLPFLAANDDETSSIASRLSWLEILGAAPRALFVKKSDGPRSVREKFGALCGTSNFERVLSPCLAAVACQPADEFPAAALFKKRPRRKDLPRSFTLSGGLQSVIERLATIPGIETRVGIEAIGVARTEAGFAVELSDGSGHDARRLAFAAPPTRIVHLARQISPALVEPLSRFRESRFRTLGASLPVEAVKLRPVAGLIPMDRRYLSVVSRDVVPDDRRRAFAMHFHAETDFETAHERLARLLGAQPAVQDELRCEQRLPVLEWRSHAERLRAVDEAIAGQPLLVTGNWFEGLALEDCVSRSKREVERVFG